MLHVLRSIAFFRDFLAAKSFRAWDSNVCASESPLPHLRRDSGPLVPHLRWDSMPSKDGRRRPRSRA